MAMKRKMQKKIEITSDYHKDRLRKQEREKGKKNGIIWKG